MLRYFIFKFLVLCLFIRLYIKLFLNQFCYVQLLSAALCSIFIRVKVLYKSSKKDFMSRNHDSTSRERWFLFCFCGTGAALKFDPNLISDWSSRHKQIKIRRMEWPCEKQRRWTPSGDLCMMDLMTFPNSLTCFHIGAMLNL